MKYSSLFFQGITVFILCLMIACQSEEGTTKKSDFYNEDISPENEALSSSLNTKDLVYAWVDKLNIRDAPNLAGKTVTTVKSDEALEFTGEKSTKTEEIVLRSVAYVESWLKVITSDKIEGWVFGGAVKRKKEKKGNPPISEDKFDFPYFGKFDLSEWKEGNTKEEGGGDADISTTTYQKDNQTLEISYINVGDYGYGWSHKLMDAKGKTLKERDFDFALADGSVLSETVKDYTSNPPVQYFRRQNLKKHHSQLNDLPRMVNGEWTENSIKD